MMPSTLRFHDAPCEAINQLIQTIKPSRESVERRYGVQEYVRKIITRCFAPEQVNAYMFGSVPLRTYLPDGDIDLSVFCAQEVAQSMRDTWALKLQGVIEQEQAAGSAPFRIGDVTVINAEVKLLKCLVDNIVVDISFNQMGGLVTLNFLEEINSLIGSSNIFKRSIILVKAWCYYESRLLGAHHGLISTYALETLVLYVFNKYHGSIDSPLTVLYNFLVEFSSFDWDNYCVSLQGPVPLKDLPSLPSAHVDASLAPQDTLLQCDSRLADSLARFRAEMASSRADMNGKAFVVRCLNIMDPLLPNNNLGRSVVRSSFARIRRAFGHGATLLRPVASKEPDAAVQELDRLFRNTWAALQKHNNAMAASPAQQQQQPGVLTPVQIATRLPKQIQLQLQQPMQQLQQQQQQQPDRKGTQQPFTSLQAELQPAENGPQQQTRQQHSDLGQQRGLASQAAQQQQALLLQHSMGQLLLDACCGAGVSLEAFLASPREQQVTVLLKHLQLPLSTATIAALLAPGQQQQQCVDQQLQLLGNTSVVQRQQWQQQQQQQQQQLPPQTRQQQQPPGLADDTETTPSHLPPAAGAVASAAAHLHIDAAAVPNSPRSPAKKRADELVAPEAAAAAAAERAMANLGLPKGGSPSKGQQQKLATSVKEMAAGLQQEQPPPSPAATSKGPHTSEPAVAAVIEEEQQQQQQPAPAEDSFAQPSATAEEQQELENLLQQPELLAAAGAVDFNRVKAAVLAAGADGLPTALVAGPAGHQDTALQSQLQHMPSSSTEGPMRPQQHVSPSLQQGQVVLLRHLLQFADLLAQSSAAQQPHPLLPQHRLSLVQRSSSVPPVLSASSSEALAVVAAAPGVVSTVGSLDVPTSQQPQHQLVPAVRGLERSASAGNLQSLQEQPQASAHAAAAAAALAIVKQQAAVAAYASRALMNPLLAYPFSSHAANIAAAAAAAATMDAQHSQAGLLQQLQQQQYQLILQQQEQLVQQQQQQQVDVLEGNLEQLTYNLQMAKAYVFNHPLPSKQPLQRQQPFAPQLHAVTAPMASNSALAAAGSIMAADAPLQGQQYTAVGHARLQMEQQLRMLVQMGATANGVAVPALHNAVPQQPVVDHQQQLPFLLQQQQQQLLAGVLDRPGSAGVVQHGPPAPASRSSTAAAEPTAIQPDLSTTQQQAAAPEPCTAEQPCTKQQELSAGVAGSSVVPDLAPAAADEVKPATSSIAKYTPPHRRTSQGNAAAAVAAAHSSAGAGAAVPHESKQGGDTAAHNSSASAADGSCDCGVQAQQQEHEQGPAVLGPAAVDGASAAGDDGSSAPAVSGVPSHMAPIKTGSLCDSPTPQGPVSSAAVTDGPTFTGRPTAAGQEACMSAASTTTASPALLAFTGRAATPKTPLSAKAAPFVSRFAAPLSSAGSGAAGAAAFLAASRASNASEAAAAAPIPVQAAGGSDVEAVPADAAETGLNLPSEQQQQQQQQPAMHAQVLAVRQHQLRAVGSSGSFDHSPLVSISSYDTAESTHFESTPGTPGSPPEQQNSQGAVASEESLNFAGGKPALSSSSEPSSGRSSRASTSAPSASAADSAVAGASDSKEQLAASGSAEGSETPGALEVFPSVEAELEVTGVQQYPNKLAQVSELDSSQGSGAAEGLQQGHQQLAATTAAAAEAPTPSAATASSGSGVAGRPPASGTAGETSAAGAAAAAAPPAPGQFSSADGSEHTTDSSDSIGRSCTCTDELIESRLGLEMELTDDIYTPSTRSLHSYDDEAAVEHTDDLARQVTAEGAYTAGSQRQQQQQQQPRGTARGSRSSSSGHQQHHPLPPPPPPPPKHEQLQQQQQQPQQFLDQQSMQLAWLPLEASSALGGNGPHVFLEPNAALGGSGHLLLEPTAAVGGSGPLLTNSAQVPGVQSQQQQLEQPAAAARSYGSQIPKKPKLSTSNAVSSSTAEVSAGDRLAVSASAAGPTVPGQTAQVLYGPASGLVSMGAGAMRMPGLVGPLMVPFTAPAGVGAPAASSPVSTRHQLLNAASGGGAGPKAGDGSAQIAAVAAVQGLNAVGDAAGGGSRRRSFGSGVPASSTASLTATSNSMKGDRMAQPPALLAAASISSQRPGDVVGSTQQSGSTAHAGAGTVLMSGLPSPRSLSRASNGASHGGGGAAVRSQAERIGTAVEQQQMAGGLSRQHSTQASTAAAIDQQYAVATLTAAGPSDVRNNSIAEGARLPMPAALTPAAVQHAAVMQVASLQAAAAMGMMPQDIAAKQIAAALQAHQAAAAGQLVRPPWLDGTPAMPMFLGMPHSTPGVPPAVTQQQQQQEGQGGSRAEEHSAAPISSSAVAAGKSHLPSVGPYAAAGGRSGSSGHTDRGSSGGTPAPGQPGTVQSPRAAAAAATAAAAAAAAAGVSGAMPIASSPHPQLPPMLATMLSPLSSSLGAFSPVPFPGPAAFMSHPGLMGPLMFPMVPAAFAAAPPLHPAGMSRTGSTGGGAAAAGASLQRGGSGRHSNSSVSLLGHTDAAGQQELGRPGSQAGQSGGTAAQGHSRQSSLGGQLPREQQQYKDMQQHFVRDQQQRMEQQIREQHQHQQADYQQQQYRIDQQHYTQRQYGQQQYREQQHRSEHYREQQQQQQQHGSIRHHSSAAYHSSHDGHPPPGFVSRRGQQQQQLQQQLSNANEVSSSGGVYHLSNINSRQTSQGSEAGYATGHHQQQQQQLPSGSYRLQQHSAGATASSTAAEHHHHHHTEEASSNAGMSGGLMTAADPTSAVKRAAAHSPGTSSKLTPGTGVYVPGAAALVPEQQQQLTSVPEQQQQVAGNDKYLQQQQQGLLPARGSGVVRPRGMQQQQQTLPDVQPGQSTGSIGSGSFTSVQHPLRDHPAEEGPLAAVHWQHPEQAVEQHQQQQQPKGSRLSHTDSSAAAGGPMDSSAVPAAPVLQQQEQPAVEYSTGAELGEGVLAQPRGTATTVAAAAAGRPRVPVATVVSLVQATQEDRERQSKQKERRMAAAASMARTQADQQQHQQQHQQQPLDAATAGHQQEDPAEHTMQQHNNSQHDHKQQPHLQCEDADSPADILHALPLHMSRLRSAGAASSSVYSLTSSNCSSGTGTPRAGGSGGGEAAAAGTGGGEGSDRRRSRSVGVSSGLSRLFTQAVHRAVEHRAAEDLQQSPMHAAPAGSASASSGVSGSAPDAVQQQQQQPSTQQQAAQQQQQVQQQQVQQQQPQGQLHQPVRQVSEGAASAGIGRAAGSSGGSGGSINGKRGAAAMTSRSPDERASHGIGDGFQQQRSGPAIAAAAAIAAALGGGGAGRRVIGRKASRDDVAQQQHHQQNMGPAAPRERYQPQQQGGGSQQQATMHQQSSASSKANKAGAARGPAHSRQDTAGGGHAQVQLDQEQHQQRGSRPSAVSVSPPLDDVNLFPSLPTSGAASPAAVNKGWVAPRPTGGSSAGSSRRASADGAVAGSSAKHSRGEAAQLGTAGGSILHDSTGKETKLGRVRGSHRSDSSNSLHGLAQSSSQQELASMGGAGRSSSSSRHQRGASHLDRKSNQEFQLADEDFPALGAAAAAAGKSAVGGISRKGSTGRLDASGSRAVRLGTGEEECV